MKHNIVNKEEYKGFYKKRMRCGTSAEKAAYLRENQRKCIEKSNKNPNELWFLQKLKSANLPVKFNRQTIWGYRIYDFWCHAIGCAIEIDGPEHDESYDRYRDVYNYLRSGIIVLRVRNKNEEDAAEAIELIKTISPWPERRKMLGIDKDGIIGKIDITKPNGKYWKR